MPPGIYDRTKSKPNSGQFERGVVPWNKGKELPRGRNNPNWKGEEYTFVSCYRGKGRYKAVYARYRRGEDGKWKPEHTLIVEKILGRKLKRKKECVHHINGNSLDNRNENLLVCSPTYHTWLHQRMAELYAKERFGG